MLLHVRPPWKIGYRGQTSAMMSAAQRLAMTKAWPLLADGIQQEDPHAAAGAALLPAGLSVPASGLDHVQSPGTICALRTTMVFQVCYMTFWSLLACIHAHLRS